MAAFWKRPRLSNAWADALQAGSPEAARWLTERLLASDLTRGVRVGDVLPTGFQAYVRIMHPVPTPDGPTTWTAIAERTGRVAHSRMQWQAIAYPAPGHQPPVVAGDGPSQGAFPLELMVSLIDILSIHTSTAETVHFTVWEGTAELPESDASTVDLAGRRHLVFTADLSAGTRAIVLDPHGAPIEPHISPNVWWPDDRTWVVATDVDFRSTLVAAPRDCADQILADATFEAFEVAIDDRADLGGDDRNPLPPPLAHLFS